MIDVFNKKITLRVGDDEVIFDVDQSIKRPTTEDDECYGIDDLDDTINKEAQELLANDEPDSFLSRGLEKSIYSIQPRTNELEEVKKEKECIDFKIEKFNNALKDLDSLLRNQRLVIDKKGLGFNEYNTVPPPPAQVYSPLKKDLCVNDVSNEQEGYMGKVNSAFSEQGGSVGNVVSKPMISMANCGVKWPRGNLRTEKIIRSPTGLEVKPVWNNSKRVNHHYSTRITHPNPKRNFVPKAVLMKTEMRPVNVAKPKAAYNAVKRNRFNDVKALAYWVWMPKNRVVDHVSKNISTSVALKRLDYIDAQGRFKSVMAWMDAQAQGRQECSKEKEESREECIKSRKTKKMKWEDCWELNTSELVLPRDELVLLSQQLVLLEENSSYCSRLQLPVLNQSVNTARITAVGEKVNAAESLLVVSTEVNAN
ncbi:hypothetical protein Tco_1468276 [Tanacetum coccineum]